MHFVCSSDDDDDWSGLLVAVVFVTEQEQGEGATESESTYESDIACNFLQINWGRQIKSIRKGHFVEVKIIINTGSKGSNWVGGGWRQIGGRIDNNLYWMTIHKQILGPSSLSEELINFYLPAQLPVTDTVTHNTPPPRQQGPTEG